MMSQIIKTLNTDNVHSGIINILKGESLKVLIKMNKKKQPLFLTKIQENNQNYEYLGSDGLPIDESYAQYLKKCSEFITKARLYKKNNLNIKNSLLHQVQYGYQNTESSEETILNERKEQLDEYGRAFDVTRFHNDQSAMYKNTKGQSKRIRIIRDLTEEKISEEFTDNFYQGTKTWFTRYCTLSKFIQAGRMIIILNRLNKNLNILRKLTPEDVAKFEINENEPEPAVNDILSPVFLPCNYCPEDRQSTK